MLRQLHPNGQPKLDSELSAGEVEGRRLELEDDRRMEIVRAVRVEQENALLQRVRGGQSVTQAIQSDQAQVAAEAAKPASKK